MKLEESLSGANHFIGALAQSPQDTLSKTWRGLWADSGYPSPQTKDTGAANAAASIAGLWAGVAVVGKFASVVVAMKAAPLTLGASALVAASVADRYLEIGTKLAEQDNNPPPPTP